MIPLKILHIAPTFFPATYYGGPIESTYALCNALAARCDVSLKVLTTDSGGPSLAQRIPVTSCPMIYPNGYEVFFARSRFSNGFSLEFFARLVSMIRWADVVHLTGTYSMPTIPTLLFSKIVKRPVLWSPRGALLATATWSGASHKRLKRVWEFVCGRVMPRQTLLHVTSESERFVSVLRLPALGAIVIPNGINLPPASDRQRWFSGGVLRVMFLGRLVPVKGIEILIEAIALVARGSVHLGLYGAGDPPYIDTLKALVLSLGLTDQITFHGYVSGAAKTEAFSSSDLLVLSSFSENFGMVVAESLAHGVPVVVSRDVPWAGVESRDCGRWVENTPAAIAAAVENLRSCDLKSMGFKGRAWMQQDFDWNSIAARTKAALTSLVDFDPKSHILGGPGDLP